MAKRSEGGKGEEGEEDEDGEGEERKKKNQKKEDKKEKYLRNPKKEDYPPKNETTKHYEVIRNIPTSIKGGGEAK